MKKTTIALVVSLLLIPLAGVSAQMMNGVAQTGTTYPYGMMGQINGSSTQAMSSEEAAGYAIAQKLQAKTLTCADLSQDNYESLGEYYMGLMTGSSHETMDQYIEKTYGTDYLKSMHIAMGERFSGCNANASFPAGMMGFGPMMGSWGSSGFQNGQGNWQGRGNSMMGWGFPGMMSGYGYGIGGTVFMVILWILAIVGLVAVIKWIINISNSKK